MLKKAIALIVSTSLLLQNASIVYADNIKLPDMGTAAAATLSIGQEKEMGDYYMRLLRGSAPIINDPVLNQYINDLGKKLVSKSESVQTPFHFYVMRSNVLNAFAFFGGNVVVHSRLILDTDNESQLASVMAHEIGHVTQRHLARAMEAQNSNSPYVWGATLGSLLLTLANPEAGMAAMTTTMASSTQSMISFTQSNEQEADRVGLRTLTKAGFDPYASSEFLQKLADQSRFSSKPPEILMTHPLPNSRLSDIRNRSLQYSKKNVTPSLNYYLAKARIAILMSNKTNARLLIEGYRKLNNEQSKIAVIYANALVDYNNNNYPKAKQQLQPLLDNDPNNIWYIDLMTDIDLALNNSSAAISRLQSALKKSPNSSALQLNLANAYVKARNYQQAVSLLHRYTFDHNDDTNGWDLLITAYGGLKSRAQEMSARAESIALEGNFPDAIRLLTNAKTQAKGNQTLIAKIDARISQLKQLQKRYAVYSRR
ncbi:MULTISPECIES: M48 family metalloprotease [unclassified Gilliamella]|uniref:beta-barrel assembly-enhancing protease n=1 Tax=unclassified Gilliamella TaxID=2685620 RepID=UPI0018DDEA87|nr:MULTISPECIES: M48 family metalloprotease [unclassified Gilliamella]MBI0038267.1 M48 family metallopeptidase [Gilliamella sp. B14384G10]MBI0040436.1 M48 family metallopeptidase [Gilliamella sp. B14384G7]MBI0052275.1 M48 family metallopeptidase [Gilliamella sp. B14384G13]MBI0054554.1 M48 family metallopeptidase [Gilliamella sp. B14384H2]